jgi:hypothetical protein
MKPFYLSFPDKAACDRALYGVAVGLHVIDGTQTAHLQENGLREAGILSDHPSDREIGAHKGAALLLTWGLCEVLPPELRSPWLAVTNLGMAAIVIHNHSVGARP